jgi:hypothetical protein
VHGSNALTRHPPESQFPQCPHTSPLASCLFLSILPSHHLHSLQARIDCVDLLARLFRRHAANSSRLSNTAHTSLVLPRRSSPIHTHPRCHCDTTHSSPAGLCLCATTRPRQQPPSQHHTSHPRPKQSHFDTAPSRSTLRGFNLHRTHNAIRDHGLHI